MNDRPIADNGLSAGASRNALRKAMLAQRQALDSAVRRAFSARIVATLEARLDTCRPDAIGAYWPMRGEVDVRTLMHNAHERGIAIALPQVVKPDLPLRFVRWTPQTSLREDRRGALLTGEAEEVTPDLLLVPCVGFDARRYRLGYGGGFYDRTLAARPVQSWGVAYACSRMAGFEPQAHDLTLDAIITEDAVYE